MNYGIPLRMGNHCHGLSVGAASRSVFHQSDAILPRIFGLGPVLDDLGQAGRLKIIGKQDGQARWMFRAPGSWAARPAPSGKEESAELVLSDAEEAVSPWHSGKEKASPSESSGKEAAEPAFFGSRRL